MKITTNNQWRPTIGWCDLTVKEQADFDYDGADEGSYFRYKGDIRALADYTVFGSVWANPTVEGDILHGWHAVHNDSAFSGTLIKMSDCGEAVVVGTYFS